MKDQAVGTKVRRTRKKPAVKKEGNQEEKHPEENKKALEKLEKRVEKLDASQKYYRKGDELVMAEEEQKEKSFSIEQVVNKVLVTGSSFVKDKKGRHWLIEQGKETSVSISAPCKMRDGKTKQVVSLNFIY